MQQQQTILYSQVILNMNNIINKKENVFHCFFPVLINNLGMQHIHRFTNCPHISANPRYCVILPAWLVVRRHRGTWLQPTALHRLLSGGPAHAGSIYEELSEGHVEGSHQWRGWSDCEDAHSSLRSHSNQLLLVSLFLPLWFKSDWAGLWSHWVEQEHAWACYVNCVVVKWTTPKSK